MKKQEFDKMMKESFGDRVVNIPTQKQQATKLASLKPTPKQQASLINWYDSFVDYVLENHRNIYNNACEFADKKVQE